VSTVSQVANVGSLAVPLSVCDPEACWYAIRTRSRHEKVAANELAAQGVRVFLPLVTSVRRWSDRRKEVELPLFPGYAFVRVSYFSRDRVRVLRATGVVNFVGPNVAGASIPDEQIDAISRLLVGKVPVNDHPFLKVGQRVRIRSGSLSGMEGILLAINGLRSLVISVEPIQRSLSISLDGYDVEVL
jgi:transcription antitermination factor NusG